MSAGGLLQEVQVVAEVVSGLNGVLESVRTFVEECVVLEEQQLDVIQWQSTG